MTIRKRIIARDPICKHCEAKGKTTLTEVIDHIKPLAEGGSNDDSNLMGLCHPCHDAKTQAEAARAQGRTVRPRQAFGTDGWPV